MIQIGLSMDTHSGKGQWPTDQVRMAIAEPPHGEKVPVVIEHLIHHESAPISDLEPVLIANGQAKQGSLCAHPHELYGIHLLEEGHRVDSALQCDEIEIGRSGMHDIDLGSGQSSQREHRAGRVKDGRVGPSRLSPFREQLHRAKLGRGRHPHGQGRNHQCMGCPVHLRGRFWNTPEDRAPYAAPALP